MTVELFVLCDYAKNDNGRLTIVDTFDSIRAAKLPWRAYFGFALKMLAGPDDFDDKELTLKIASQENPDAAIFETSTKLTSSQKKGSLSIAGNLKGLIFEQAGLHDFKVLLGGQEIYSHTFMVEVENKE